jgi:uncharacterized protein YecT (DUF1311 family)
MKSLVIVAALWVAQPAQAQELIYSDDATWNCLATTSGRLARMGCVGLSADACMQATPSGETTVGMGGCLDRELRYWDQVLNSTYGQYQERASALDAENATISDNLPKLSVPLREMQRAWIPFRDATCDYERAQWGGGSGGGPATLRCHMRVTGEQALALDEQWLGE